MIASLRGVLQTKEIPAILIDVHGVGYEVFVSLLTLQQLPEVGQQVELLIHTHLRADGRNDTLQLFGFLEKEEKEVFFALTSVSGIGPKQGMNFLSHMDARTIAHVVLSGDLRKLHAIPGVGKKTAERILIELKDRMAKLIGDKTVEPVSGGSFNQVQDLELALKDLGYNPKQIQKCVGKLEKQLPPDTPLLNLVEEAIRMLSS